MHYQKYNIQNPFLTSLQTTVKLSFMKLCSNQAFEKSGTRERPANLATFGEGWGVYMFSRTGNYEKYEPWGTLPN